MTTQISQSARLDLEVHDGRGPVIDFPGSPAGHFVEVKITSGLSLLVTTAAEAQELEIRFAAARQYLSGELAAAGAAAEITRRPAEGRDDSLDDAGDDITDALVPDVDAASDLPPGSRCSKCGHTDDLIRLAHPYTHQMGTWCREPLPCNQRVAVLVPGTAQEADMPEGTTL